MKKNVSLLLSLCVLLSLPACWCKKEEPKTTAETTTVSTTVDVNALEQNTATEAVAPETTEAIAPVESVEVAENNTQAATENIKI